MKFAVETPQVVEFDGEDAPGVNILGVVPSKEEYEEKETEKPAEESDDKESVPIVEEGREDGASFGQKFSVHGLSGTVEYGFDTDKMSVAELREALKERGLSRSGRKSALKRRLENDLMGQSAVDEKKAKKAAKTPEWLSWD